jgi:hypothetical protein
MLTRSNPEVAKELLKDAQEEVLKRWKIYENMAAAPVNGTTVPATPETKDAAAAKAAAKGAGSNE